LVVSCTDLGCGRGSRVEDAAVGGGRRGEVAMPKEEAARMSRRRRSQAAENAEDAEDEAFILAHAGETQLTPEEIFGIDAGRDNPDAPVPDDIN
jgi:hypothetical protein